jgi:hypothetical protein
MENSVNNVPKQETGISKIVNLYNVSHTEVGRALAQEIKDGNVDPVKLHLAIKRMEKIIEVYKEDKNATDIIKNEVQKYVDRGEAKIFGATLSVGNVYTTYDFGACDDMYYNELISIKNKVDALIKERQEFLKSLFGDTTRKLGIQTKTIVIDHMPTFELLECGEDCQVNPPVKISRDGVKVRFNKES